MRPIRDGHCIDPGVARQCQIVRRVADHERVYRLDARAIHERLQHVGVGLGKTFVSAA